MATYDKHYQKEDLFGKPYAELIDFFAKYEPKGELLDLGCGQGRNAIPLAKMDYKVTGIDISEVGIKQMLKNAETLGLKIIGIVGDIYQFEISDRYDMVLLDSMFHFYKNDRVKEAKFLQKIAHDIKIGGIICIFVLESGQIVANLTKIIKKLEQKWQIIEERYLNYPEQNMQYKMVIAQKLSQH